MADVKLNYREFVENGRVPGTTEHYIMNYEFSSDSGDEIKDNGLYFDQLTQRWYKDFYYASNTDGYSFYFPVMMSVSENEGVYSFKSSAFARQRDADDFVSRVGRACGLDNREGLIRLSDIIINSADKEILNNLGVKVIRNDEGGIIDFEVTEFINFDTLKLEPNYDLIDYIYDLFNQEFGDVSRTYSGEYIDYPDGPVGLFPDGSDALADKISFAFQEGDMAGGLSPDQVNALIKEIAAEDNEYIKKVFSHNFQRIGFSGAGLGPNVFYMYIYGYDINNNQATFINGVGQAQLTNIDGIKYTYRIDTGEKYLDEHFSALGPYTSIMLTTPTDGTWYKTTGLSSGTGNTFNATMFDSIGSAAAHKPYNLIEGYTFPDRAPDRVSDIPTDREPEDEPPQDYWPIGEPSPDPIKVKPPIGGIPPIPRDTPSDNTLPDEETPLSSKGMIHVYNPTDEKLSSFSGYLWSEDVRTAITQIWKNNPMDGIISCHELYIQPERDDDNYILLGYLVAETVGAVHTCKNRYETLHCGYKHINRFWNNARDYQTKIGIYLPFIGIRELDVDDVLDSDVYVDYKIDVITGDCTAVISVNRKNSSGITLEDRKVLYMFDGNCSVPIPLTGADRNSLYSGVIGGAISTIGGIMSGNPFAAVGGVMNAVSAKPQIEKSGNLGGNRGAMAFKKPYLIITRPIPNEPKLRAQLLGKPSNRSVRVKDVKGYTVFKQVHVDTIGNATDTEKAMIDNLLKSGVIL